MNLSDGEVIYRIKSSSDHPNEDNNTLGAIVFMYIVIGTILGFLVLLMRKETPLVVVALLLIAVVWFQDNGHTNSESWGDVDVAITVPVDAFLLGQTVNFKKHEFDIALQPQTHIVSLVNGINTNGLTITEGPTYDPRTDNFYFSEVESDRIYRISSVSDKKKARLEVWKENSQRSNGLKYNAGGGSLAWLYACESKNDKGAIVRYNLANNERQVIANEYQGLHLVHPNDLTFDAKNRLYFTDRAPPKPGNIKNGGVYRLDPPRDIDGTKPWSITKIIDNIHQDPISGADRANGIVISPDDSTLYIVETNDTVGGQRTILAYDLDSDGEPSNKRVFHRFNPGRSGDGMTVDVEGNLYVNGGLNRPRNDVESLDTRAGVHVFDPSGSLIDFIPLPVDLATNVCFGGPDLTTLFANSGHKIYSWQNDVVGTMR